MRSEMERKQQMIIRKQSVQIRIIMSFTSEFMSLLQQMDRSRMEKPI